MALSYILDRFDSLELENEAQRLFREGDYAHSEALYREALAIGERACGPNSFEMACALNDLGEVQVKRGNYVEAEMNFRKAVDTFRNGSKGDFDITVAKANLARILKARDDFANTKAMTAAGTSSN